MTETNEDKYRLYAYEGDEPDEPIFLDDFPTLREAQENLNRAVNMWLSTTLEGDLVPNTVITIGLNEAMITTPKPSDTCRWVILDY